MSRPLAGTSVTLAGTFPGFTKAYLKNLLASLGAAVTGGATKKTTHVVTTDDDFGTNSIVRAARPECHIVSLEWVHESHRNGTKADEADFIIDGTSANGATVNGKSHSQTNGANGANGADDDDGSQAKDSTVRRSGRKRAAATPKGEDDSTAPPNPKKSKTKAPKAQTDDAGDEEDEPAKASPADQDAETSTKEVKQEKPVVADGQVLKSKGAVIPIDEGVTLSNPTVYVDDDDVIYDAALNQTNSGRNNNKFYRLQLLKSGSSYHTWTRWGRVGENGQSALLGSGSLDDALKQFDKKFKDKTGLRWADRSKDPKPNKYAFVERSYDPDSDDDDDDNADVKGKVKDEEDDGKILDCTLEKPVQDLLGLIFNNSYFSAAFSDLNYDAKKLPLGKLSKATILRGFQALKEIAALMDDPSIAQATYGTSSAQATENLSNLFYSLIPHDFGRNRPPVIQSQIQLKKEIELLESLSDMKDAAEIMKIDKKGGGDEVHPLDVQFKGLNLQEMSVLDPKGGEFKQIEEYLQGSKGDTHHHSYKVQDIFRIERQGETERFEKSEFAKIKSDKRLLWHGSRCTNYGGILSQGLRIAPPEAPVNGYMFGKGVYLADMVGRQAPGSEDTHMTGRD